MFYLDKSTRGVEIEKEMKKKDFEDRKMVLKGRGKSGDGCQSRVDVGKQGDK